MIADAPPVPNLHQLVMPSASQAIGRSSSSRISNVYLCFFASAGVTPSSSFAALAYWSVSFLRETYSHVECLFCFDGDVVDEGSNNWHALSVNEQNGSGLWRRTMDSYRLGRWAILRLNNLTPDQRRTLYAFAQHENREPRAYKFAAAISTTPYLSVCTPIVTYTPGCSLCLSSGPRTVFCAQLILEMLNTVFDKQLSDLDFNAIRPDRLFSLCKERLDVVQAVLSWDAGHMGRIIADTLR